MWAVLVAMVVAGPRPPARPMAQARTELRTVLAQPAAGTHPEVVRRVEAQEATGSLVRVLNGLELNGPVVLKPEFHGGPGAVIALRF